MPIRTASQPATADALRAEPDVLFVHEVDLKRRSIDRPGRLAGAEPNAVGIPTFRAASRGPERFLADDDLRAFQSATGPAFARLARHLHAGGTIVLPEAGLGEGESDLLRRAPLVWYDLQDRLDSLRDLAAQ